MGSRREKNKGPSRKSIDQIIGTPKSDQRNTGGRGWKWGESSFNSSLKKSLKLRGMH